MNEATKKLVKATPYRYPTKLMKLDAVRCTAWAHKNAAASAWEELEERFCTAQEAVGDEITDGNLEQLRRLADDLVLAAKEFAYEVHMAAIFAQNLKQHEQGEHEHE